MSKIQKNNTAKYITKNVAITGLKPYRNPRIICKTKYNVKTTADGVILIDLRNGKIAKKQYTISSTVNSLMNIKAIRCIPAVIT